VAVPISTQPVAAKPSASQPDAVEEAKPTLLSSVKSVLKKSPLASKSKSSRDATDDSTKATKQDAKSK
jgi:hypothetical protein